jgi:hypothetical protein
MATRRIDEQFSMQKTVTALGAVTRGFLLERTALAATVVNCTTAASGMYVAAHTAAAGAGVKVYAIGSGCIPVVVGTAGATAGVYAAWDAMNDGFSDAPALADGDTVTPTFGVFEDTGVAGDIVGLHFHGRSFVESV